MRSAFLFIFLCLYLFAKAQLVTTVAGNGATVFNGDGTATSAAIKTPGGIAFDRKGNMYITDANYRIRKVTPAGTMITIAGTGVFGNTGDGGPAINATVGLLSSITCDSIGNVYFRSSNNIRVIDTLGIINRFAGNGSSGYTGDGGPALSASFNSMEGMTFDKNGNLFVADRFNHVIRKIDVAGNVSTVVGIGTQGFGGDGGSAINALLNYPNDVAFDDLGNMYVADMSNNRIRKIDASGIITTVAGTGSIGFSGDGGAALLAALSNPCALSFDKNGGMYIADLSNNRIRKVSSGVITTYAGNTPSAYNGENVLAASAQLSIKDVQIDTSMIVYFADNSNNRVRKISYCSSPIAVNINANADTICGGNPLYLKAMGANSYLWSANAGSSTLDSVLVNPSSNTTYSVTGYNGQCAAIRKVTVIPNLSVISGTKSICKGASTTLTATPAASYTWSSNAGGYNTSSVVLNPFVTTTYTVSTSNAGCLLSTPVTVTVSPNLTVSSSANNICNGDSVILTANGATTYTWTAPALPNLQTQSVVVKPSVTTTYQVNGTTGSCMEAKFITIHVINNVKVYGPNQVCAGDSITLKGDSSVSYMWMPGSFATQKIKIAPLSNMIYTVTGTTGTCVATYTHAVNVVTCAGNSCTNVDFESGTFADWYGYRGYDTLTTAQLVPFQYNIQTTVVNAPFYSGSYFTLVDASAGTDPYGCFPMLAPSSGNYSVRLGDDGNEGGTGQLLEQEFEVGSSNTAFTYEYAAVLHDAKHWLGINPNFKAEILDVNDNIIPSLSFTLESPGPNDPLPSGCFMSCNSIGYPAVIAPWTTRNIDLTPYLGQKMKIRFSVSGCAQIAGAHFGYAYVDCSCAAKINTVGLCPGSTTVLNSPAGYATYSWSGPGIVGSSATQTITVNSMGMYDVVLTAQGGQTYTLSTNVTQLTAPNITTSGNYTICLGASTVLTATGAASYTWSPNAGSAQTASVSVAPGSTETYTVTGTGGNGCFNSAVVNVIVNPLPNVSINAASDTVCLGSSTILTASNAITYTWSANAGSAISNTVSVSPSVNTTYTVTGKDNNNCSATATQSVEVVAVPVISVSATSNTICIGQGVGMAAGGASTYSWSANAGSANTYSVSFFPTVTDTYTVNGTDATTGCTGAAAIVIVVQGCTGISSAAISGLSIFPNPSSGVYTIGSITESVTIEIFDSMGQIVYKTSCKNGLVNVDISNVPDGVFNLRMTDDHNNLLYKAILIKTGF